LLKVGRLLRRRKLGLPRLPPPCNWQQRRLDSGNPPEFVATSTHCAEGAEKVKTKQIIKDERVEQEKHVGN
jgi:hypothetical protein